MPAVLLVLYVNPPPSVCILTQKLSLGLYNQWWRVCRSVPPPWYVFFNKRSMSTFKLMMDGRLVFAMAIAILSVVLSCGTCEKAKRAVRGRQDRPKEFPPPRYNYTILTRYNATALASPFINDQVKNVDLRIVTATRPCEMIALIAKTNIDSILKELAAAQKTYSARLTWFKIMPTCATPIHDVSYMKCNPKLSFAMCDERSDILWQASLITMAAETDDELGLVLAAPAHSASGLYRRVIEIDGRRIYTDFSVTIPSERCPIAFEQNFGNPDRCKTPEQYSRGEVFTRRFLGEFNFPQGEHMTWLKFWFVYDGGNLPVQFYEAQAFARPVPPDNHPGFDSVESEITQNKTDPKPGQADPKPNQPFKWPSIKHLAPRLDEVDEVIEPVTKPPKTSKSNSTFVGISVGLGIAGLVLVGVILYVCLRRKKELKKSAQNGLTRLRSTFKDVKYTQLP
ncbi:membrane glycoprotein D [Equid alphaherpesvirus 1]|uniref:Envelope glycoprotein D n=11 Tax=Equid alphaherpesvirus 1 TaxID=10326 RepID=GD_EHV1B|nr:RecName: Full=Envelope glycoprotein D; Short=gD; AltName: Full=Glycoprotein 17/18; Flags: Precursor [Equine herpesvirus type 1 (strain Kentucky D)]Q6DLD9.1 RecName: Full=Envelope glycoprotein D; Short=gD; AltName: Full=Glycoprotein 17/18; Flags: Precursor [Equine herpesvirus type 1 (strain AB4P)]AAT67329.1 membrane glycoprotein D [Equid alphaherpesvirus 1]AII81485.1 envelope glycoprotein D [Equid alphaherpesvirus 1]AMB15047.1 envelope glycoprotein D [Equid alphaherpesvirus 1]AMB15126.1 enve